MKTDICIIGAGSGGLSVAAAAAQMGIPVTLIEKHKMGGDCLNYGCVPSKSLLNIAKKIHSAQKLTDYGLNTNFKINYAAIKSAIDQVIASIAPHDSVARFEALGVKVVLGKAEFVAENKIKVNDECITAKRFIVATGSRTLIPKIPNLETVSYLTNEELFSLTVLPKHLLIVGAGPIGCEMAQAFAMLGSKVTLLEQQQLLAKDDPDLVAIIKSKLKKYGVVIHENTNIIDVTPDEKNTIIMNIESNNERLILQGSHLLLATGRRGNVEDLNLSKAKVATKGNYIQVDSSLRTSNRKIYALGDVIGQLQFTHAASYHASIIIKNILFKIPAKINYRAFPWVTYTQPELAHVGLPLPECKRLARKVLSFYLKDNDRAQAEQATAGQIKVHVGKKGKILAVSICSDQAGELIAPWVLAMENKLTIKNMAETLIPYPTRSEINKRVSSQYFLPFIRSKKTQSILRFLMKYITS